MTRGEIRRLRLPHGRGHAQRGTRYGVVIQSDALAGLSTVLVAPTSTSARATSFRPTIDIDGTPTRVLVEQLRAVDVTLLSDPVGVVTINELRVIEEAIELVLDL